jgi:hypothetical protein
MFKNAYCDPKEKYHSAYMLSYVKMELIEELLTCPTDGEARAKQAEIDNHLMQVLVVQYDCKFP